MIDYITHRRHTGDNKTGDGYVVVQRTKHGTYTPISSPFKKGARKGTESRAIRRMVSTKDGSGYLSGYHIYPSVEVAQRIRHAKGLTNSYVVYVKYRGRICHGIKNGERITVAKYRTIVEAL